MIQWTKAFRDTFTISFHVQEPKAEFSLVRISKGISNDVHDYNTKFCYQGTDRSKIYRKFSYSCITCVESVSVTSAMMSPEASPILVAAVSSVCRGS